MSTRKVYFIGCVGGPIKIGVAESPHRRLMQIQTGCPFRVQLLAHCDGDESKERELHRRFRAARLSGEWFAPVPELLQMIWTVAREGESFELPDEPQRDINADLVRFAPLALRGTKALRNLIRREVPSISLRDAKWLVEAFVLELKKLRGSEVHWRAEMAGSFDHVPGTMLHPPLSETKVDPVEMRQHEAAA